MKTKLFSLAIFGMSLFIVSCEIYDHDVVPDSNVTIVQATYSEYQSIDVSTAFTVFVSFSDTDELIEIEANDNLHQYIEVRKENGVLKIGLEDNVRVRGNSTLKAYITTKSISGFEASGASRIIVENPVIEEVIHVYLSGASVFLGELSCYNLYADLSGASNLDASGSAFDFDLEVSGASVVRDYGLSVVQLDAELSGASNVFITVEDEIDVEASGASNLHYKGNATIIRKDLSGASTVKKM